jgi:hypothetical protein
MRTTQAQVAFGHNVRTITSKQMSSNISAIGPVGRAFLMRVEHTYSRAQKLTIDVQ